MMNMLVHYYDDRFPPLHSITESYSPELIGRLTNCDVPAFRRFSNWEWYIQHRIETEDALYDAFLRLGGKPSIRHPRYFVLGEHPELERAYGAHAASIRIPLDSIAPEHISFTEQDSMKLLLESDDMHLYSVQTLGFLKKAARDSTYIEAQIWDLSYFTCQ